MTQTLTTERMAEIAKLAIRLQQISSCAAVTSSGETVLRHTHVDDILSALHDVTAELLANQEAQPVVWVMIDDLTDKSIVSTPAYRSKEDAEERTIGQIAPLFTAPPALAVVKLPRAFYSDEGLMVPLEKVMASLAVCGIEYEHGGSTCRAAMLAAAPEGGNDE